MLRRVTRRKGRCPCRPGCDAGFREPAASKEIEGLDELMDVKSLLSGLLFGFSAVAKAPSRRKVMLPLQPPGYWRRCHPVNKQNVDKADRSKQQIWQEFKDLRVTSDSELSLNCSSSEAVGLLPFLRGAAFLAAFFAFLAFLAASWSYLTRQNLSSA